MVEVNTEPRGLLESGIAVGVAVVVVAALWWRTSRQHPKDAEGAQAPRLVPDV